MLFMSVSKHREAFEDFVDRAEDELGDSLKRLYLYGSVSRGEETGESDVDVFAVVESGDDLRRLRDLAFDVGVVEYGVSISVQGVSEPVFEERKDHPFIETVRGEGEVYV